jgi:hypothetical protein
MASTPQISVRSRDELLADIGTALLQVKNARGLNLPAMAERIGKSDDQLARYIAGDMEIGVVAWMRAVEAFPELVERMEEAAADRSARARQRPLDLDLPTRRSVAA